ncbi:hypothetical protein F7725_009262 [Dissostichus mawsoni]|uniref:Multidrug resistance-associated protein 4-like n=1 Tax=Dissostichus mawsoni TaxID=36200 RepID=A0A7J5Z7B1_DISMA|nr:hypothetical protein F7725_009262 [Dissostichus mawsoni]
MASSFASSKIIVFITFTVYVLLGNTLNASSVFVTVSLYGTIKLTVALLFPLAIEKLSETAVSVRRIESLDAPSLQNISITVKSHELLTVIGTVGAGKSSLLSAILGELPRDSGNLKVKGQLTYAAQQPWVFPGTIRSNILFGREFNHQRYQRVLGACALKRDMELLPDGDLTLIGDRGATLSGGQKARVNLARAVYQDADIYLLDDPLSAVDAEVGRHLFEKCICGLLKNKCRILVTHQLQYLQASDQIIVLKEGHIMAEGTYNELQSSGLNFQSLQTSDEDQECSIRSPEPDRLSLLSKRTNNSHSSQSSLLLPESRFTDQQLPAETVPSVAEESRAEGNVSGHIYLKYFTAGHSPAVLVFVVLISVLAEGAYIMQDWWLAYWFDSGCGGLWLHTQFDVVTRTGRILNRFSKDISQMDSLLPITFVNFYQNVGVIAVAASVIPLILVPVIPLIFIFLYLRRFYLRTSRDVKRLESTTRSPVFSHLSSSLQGLWTIRAFRAEERLTKAFDTHQDLHTEAWFLFLMTSRWFALYLDSICSVFVTFVTFGCILLRDGLNAGEVGLVLTYAVTLVGSFQWMVRQSAEVENMMTSVERVVEYTELESEALWETKKRPLPDWPNKGLVTFDRVSFSYSPEGAPVLKDISFTFKPNEKVRHMLAPSQRGHRGEDGRREELSVSALFRLAEPQGKIYIDGVLTSEIGLHDLRTKMSIIPQDPVLFTDTVRKNLDPFGQHSDEDLWRALEEVQLKSVVEELPRKLETVLAESGSNFSVGQRQLVCLARAVLRQNRILVIDEATANVDPRTDELIQKTIRDKFRECTVLTIAHRLNTIIDSDRIMVLDSGTIQELDRPFNLLQNKDGALYKMTQQMGRAEAAALLKAATGEEKSA